MKPIIEFDQTLKNSSDTAVKLEKVNLNIFPGNTKTIKADVCVGVKHGGVEIWECGCADISVSLH